VCIANVRLVEVQQLVSRLLNPENVDWQLCEVIGVAELHGHLYVLQNKSKSIRVSLAEKPYSLLSDVPLDGVVEPTDLAASTFDNCLYVTDTGEIGCIWRVQMEEQVVESSLEYVQLELDRDEGRSAATEFAQESEREHDRDMEVIDKTDSRVACAADGELLAAPAVVDTSITSVGGQQLRQNSEVNEKCEQSKTQDSASQFQESISGGLEQCGRPDGIDLHAFLQMISRGQVGTANVTHMAQHDLSKSSPTSEVKPMKDDRAGEMIHSLLQRTGLMKKISECGNAGPCMFEISRHYKVTRFLFIVHVTFHRSSVT